MCAKIKTCGDPNQDVPAGTFVPRSSWFGSVLEGVKTFFTRNPRVGGTGGLIGDDGGGEWLNLVGGLFH